MDQDQDKLISSLYQTQYKKMYKVGYRMTGDEELAQDMVQDAFALAIFRLDVFAQHPDQEAWLMRTLTNLIKNERRRLSARNVALDDPDAIAAPIPEEGLDVLFPSRLPQRDRDILIWRYERGMGYRDIADRLGISESGCRSRVARAAKRCGALLAQERAL